MKGLVLLLLVSLAILLGTVAALTPYALWPVAQ